MPSDKTADLHDKNGCVRSEIETERTFDFLFHNLFCRGSLNHLLQNACGRAIFRIRLRIILTDES